MSKEWNQETKYGEKEREYGDERKKQEKGGRGKNNLHQETFECS